MLTTPDNPRSERAPLDMSGDTFRSLGHELVDAIADFMDSIDERPVTNGPSPSEIRAVIGDGTLPERGEDPRAVLKHATQSLFDHSLLNGHPRFMGYITSSAAPIGALGDLLAASVNPNCGAFMLSPVATEIERQTVRWIAELIGYPTDCGGLLVSGGNMANFVGFIAGRRAGADWDIREGGLQAGRRQARVYVSQATHTWIQSAADMFGLGTDALRWIPTDGAGRMDLGALGAQIAADRVAGEHPLLVVGAAGTVGTGAIDPLDDLADLCQREDLWFHVDGAYGAMAAALPEAPSDLKGLTRADSVALDPHKWLYSPLEAGCALVRDPRALLSAFSFRPDYYLFDEQNEDPPVNLYEFGPQNSRGFRALKVWLALRQVGREGYVRMIRDDIALMRALYDLAGRHDELEAVSHNLSITTYRFVPSELSGRDDAAEYLNELNREILVRLQKGGEAFVSNAVIDGTFVLRACVVNFRTTMADIEMLPDLTVRLGHEVDSALRPAELARG